MGAGEPAAPARSGLRGRALWVVIGCLVCQMGLGYGYTFGPLAPDILEELGWTRTLWSAARAPQLFVIALASPAVGWLTVRFGARPLLVVSTLALGLVFLGFAEMEGLWQLYALTVLFGLAITGLGDITVGQVVAQWVKRGRGLALGIAYTGSNLGGFLLIRLASHIADRSSWRDAFLALAAGALLVMLPFAVLAVRPPRAGSSVEVEPGDLAQEPSAGARDMNLAAAIRTRSFWILAGSLFTFFFYFLGMIDHLVLFLTDAGIPRDEAAAHFSNAVLLGMLSKIAFGALADRLPDRAGLVLDYGVLAASSLLLLFLPDPVFLWAFVVSYGFSTAARDVVYPLIVTWCFGLRYMAQIYGALMLALLPGGALGPLFAAAVFDRTGGYGPAFATFAALNLAAVLALAFVRDERSVAREA